MRTLALLIVALVAAPSLARAHDWSFSLELRPTAPPAKARPESEDERAERLERLRLARKKRASGIALVVVGSLLGSGALALIVASAVPQGVETKMLPGGVTVTEKVSTWDNGAELLVGLALVAPAVGLDIKGGNLVGEAQRTIDAASRPMGQALLLRSPVLRF